MTESCIKAYFERLIGFPPIDPMVDVTAKSYNRELGETTTVRVVAVPECDSCFKSPHIYHRTLHYVTRDGELVGKLILALNYSDPKEPDLGPKNYVFTVEEFKAWVETNY